MEGLLAETPSVCFADSSRLRQRSPRFPRPMLGHAAALTAHWAVIHYRVAACGSLGEGACVMRGISHTALGKPESAIQNI